MPDLSKKLKSQIREHANRAWEAEMRAALGSLSAKFEEWRAGTMSTADLDAAIHEYHNGIAREIWNRFSTNDKRIALAHAVAVGLIAKDSLPVEVVEQIKVATAYFEEQGRDD
jgi:hypothetical protein